MIAGRLTWTNFTVFPWSSLQSNSNLPGGVPTLTTLVLDFFPTLFRNKWGTTSNIQVLLDLRPIGYLLQTDNSHPWSCRVSIHELNFMTRHMLFTFRLFGLPVSYHESNTYQNMPLIFPFLFSLGRRCSHTLATLWLNSPTQHPVRY
jgi:hypothetical protein